MAYFNHRSRIQIQKHDAVLVAFVMFAVSILSMSVLGGYIYFKLPDSDPVLYLTVGFPSLLLLLFTEGRSVAAIGNRAMWRDIYAAFTTDDVNWLLTEAADEAFARAADVRMKQGDMPDEDDTQYEAALKLRFLAQHREATARKRFWLLHGFFDALDFEVREKIGDYRSAASRAA